MDRLTRLVMASKANLHSHGALAFKVQLAKAILRRPLVPSLRSAKLPYGKVMLWIVLIGLISYALWGLIRAFWIPSIKERT